MNNRTIAKLQEDVARLTQQRDYQYEQACKYTRYAETLENALSAIDKLQDECLDAGDTWKCIREIIFNALETQP